MVKVLKKVLFCICITLILMNFIMYNTSFAAPGDSLAEKVKTTYNNTAGISIGKRITSGLSGIAGILFGVFKLPAIALAQIVQTVGAGVANIGRASGESIIIALTPDDIIFNEISLTSIDFFNIDGAEGIIKEIRQQIALWYYVMRTIAIVILLIILIFVGIRMAITTVASEKAIYKKALFDWATSLALVFLLHYIIRGVLWINTALVDVLISVKEEADMSEMIAALVLMVFDPDFCVGFGATIIYCIITAQTLMFLISYIKRLLVLAFLIIISPLITITYSIDKMGDQKAQALNTWLKEFAYNVLIQPFHCILYIVFVTIAIKSVGTIGSFGSMVLAILCIKFVWDGEKIVRKIFGFEQASSLAAAAASGAVIGSALSKAASAGKTAASGIKYANNSKTGQLLKQKWNDKKDTRLKNKAATEATGIKGMKYENLTEKQKQVADERIKNKKDNKSSIRKMKEAAEYRKLKKNGETGSKAELKNKAAQNISDKIKNKPDGKIKGWMKDNEFAKALGTDAQRFVRRITRPENVAKIGTAIFAGASSFAIPDSNLLTAVGTGYTVGKAAESKVRQIRNRKSENYEDDVVTACNSNSYATGVDMTNEKNRANYMDTVMAEGKNDGYTQDNINKVQKDVADRLEKNATKLGIDPEEINALLAKIKRDIVAGDGYSAKTLEGYGVDPNELNKIVGEFAAIVNNSLLYAKTDAFDTQMEPMGYDHDDVMNGIDTSKLNINNNNNNEVIEERTTEYVNEKINANSNTDYTTIQTDIGNAENEAKKEFEASIAEFERTLDADDKAKFDQTKLLNELEEIVKEAMNGGIKDIEKKVDQTLSKLEVHGDSATQIKEKVIEYKEVKEIREHITNNREKIETIIESRKPNNK